MPRDAGNALKVGDAFGWKLLPSLPFGYRAVIKPKLSSQRCDAARSLNEKCRMHA